MKAMFRHMKLWAPLFALLMPSLAAAQGLLVDVREDQPYRLPRPIIVPPPWPRPRPEPQPQSYKIKELAVDVSLKDQIARVQVTQSFVNTGSRQMEVCFVFPLPYDGAVDRMTFMVDGKEYDAKLLSAEEARRIYESYVRRNQDPALMEWIGTGMFKTSVFPVPPGAERVVSMRYNQVCRKQDGMTELLFPLSTAKYTSHAVEKLRLHVAIQSSAKIKNIYSPTHSVEISRSGDLAAQVVFSCTNEVPTTDFRLLYDVGDAKVGASVLSYRPGNEEGYFLLLVSPEIKASADEGLKKTVIFVVDRSGSMSGKKIDQAKGALRFVLNNLKPGDLFNIVAYDSVVESFRPELQRYDEESRQAAIGYCEGLYPGGSTNIDGALQAALNQLQDDQRPNYIVFLTDGLPTAGETNVPKIVENARQRNKVRARVFSFGVGYDVNSRLLDQLSQVCRGQGQFVRPNEDIEAHVSRLYSRIGAPVMTDVNIAFEMDGWAKDKGPVVNRVYPRDAYDLFAGDQLVAVGRYKQGGDVRVIIKGKVGREQQTLDFPTKLVPHSGDESHAYIEKLWAMRRIGEIIGEIDLRGKNQELIDELVALSTRHGIITPYTSFLADDTSPRELAENRRRAGLALEALSADAGISGFAQRDYKAGLQQAAQPSAMPGMGGAGRMGDAGMMAGGAYGGLAYRDIKEDREIPVRTVQHVGGKTFFLRSGRWVDSALTAEQERNVRKIARYSQEYFDLLKQHGQDAGKYLAVEGEMTVVLGGQAYAF